MNKSVAIVIPSYNEGAQLRSTVVNLLERSDASDFLLVVVDDCSKEPACEHLKGLDVSVLRHSQNLGQGAALVTGMEYALIKGVDFVVHFDADGQHSADDIPVFLQELRKGERDILLGSRFLRKSDIEQVPPAKQRLLKFAIWFNYLLTGIRLTDAHNGFRVMNREAAKALRMRNNRMAHATEVLQLIKVKNLRYAELPCHILYTEYSKAKGQSILNSLNIIVDTLMRTLLK